MASLQKKGNGWYCQFVHEKKRHTFALGPVTEEEAEAKAAHVKYLLLRLRHGLLELPATVDVVEFVRHDATPPAKRTVHRPKATKGGTLGELRDRSLAGHRGAHEMNTLDTAGIHFKHLVKTLGEDYRLSGLSQADLQKHVDRRSALGISPVTIQKEVHGLRAAWNWVVRPVSSWATGPDEVSSIGSPGRSRRSRHEPKSSGSSPAGAHR
jgi:hypothetical protein